MTYQAWLDKENHAWNLSLLFPELPKDYFKDKKDAFGPTRKKPSIVPYVSRVDLNNDPKLMECNEPRYAWEIGIKGTF